MFRPNQDNGRTENELLMLRRALTSIADVTPLLRRKFGMNDGIACTVDAVAKLLDEVYQANTSKTHSESIRSRLRREREAVRNMADNVGAAQPV
jgi:hypothetical protein